MRFCCADLTRRAFVLDTRIRALVPLAEQCPEGIDAKAWRRAITVAGESLEAVRRCLGAYPDDRTVTIDRLRGLDEDAARVRRAGRR
jgi:hypothetical protein